MIRLATILLAISISLGAQRIPDNVKHLAAGSLISIVVGDVTYQVTDRVGISLGLGFAAGVGAGIAKEYVWDRKMGRGVFSKADMIDTGVGAMVGTFGLFMHIMHRKDREREKIEELRRKYQ